MSSTKRANGDIRPSRFVEILTADDSVTESDANDPIHGIAQEYPRDAPIPSASTLAAAAGDDLKIYEPGDECLLELGGTIARGARIQSDADGKGVTLASTAATQFHVGAIALESGVSGDFIRVRVHNEIVTIPA